MTKYISSICKIVILFLFAACAIQRSPEGGAKDILPPKLTKSDPPNKTIRFEKLKINLYFNEYVGLNNPSQEIIISPLVNPQPKFSIHKKGILIKFEEKLKDSTTYTIQFGRSVADITENNVIENLTFVFSTGPKLDSTKLKGKVKDVLTNIAGDNIKVMLHKVSTDSCIYKTKPEYYAKTNKTGEFALNNLNNSQYIIYALDDENGNYLFDRGERIAYSDEKINLSNVVPPIDLKLFKEKEVKLRAVDFGRKDRDKFYIDFNAAIDSLELYYFSKDSLKQIKKNIKIIESRDSAYFWIFPETDSLKIKVDMWGENYISDTLLINIQEEKKEKKHRKPAKLTVKTTFNLYTTGKIYIDFNEPVTKFDKSKLLFYIDTIKSTNLPEMIFTDSSYTQIGISYPFEYEKNYKLIVLKGALTGFDTITNDSIVIPLKTVKETDLGIISVNISYKNSGVPIIVQLLDDKYKILKENTILETKKLTYNNLLPGKYMIRCIIDTNKNGKWDTGNLLKKRQPEDVIYFKDEINLKANWELSDLQIKIP